ncbi:MAG TPA: type II secretion system F family protein [Actinomycetes bacterium]|nr:type II secretion system F family protein [Actinomycetes bacterium]
MPADVGPDRQTRGWLTSLGAALAMVVLFGGVVGWLVGAALGYGLHRWRQNSRSRQDDEETTRRTLALPITLDLLSACLSTGSPPADGLRAVGSCVGGALGEDLLTVAAAMHSGADAAEAWSLVDAADLQALAAILSRAQVSGASPSPLLVLLADQHRQRARAVAMDAARSLGVRVTGPLGLCFLPAFVVIAVVPLVIAVLPFQL